MIKSNGISLFIFGLVIVLIRGNGNAFRICEIFENSPPNTSVCKIDLQSEASKKWHLMTNEDSFHYEQDKNGKLTLQNLVTFDREEMMKNGKCLVKAEIEKLQLNSNLINSCWKDLTFSVTGSLDRIFGPPRIEHIYVAIQDINDNKPTFEVETFQVDISEGIDPQIDSEDKLIYPLIKAKDIDSGINSNVKYSLKGHENLFSLNYIMDSDDVPSIRLMQKLDRESCLGYELELTATDHEFLSSTTRILIRVLDVDDNVATIFVEKVLIRQNNGISDSKDNNSVIIVPENTRIGSNLAKLSIRDADKIPWKKDDPDKTFISAGSYKTNFQCDYPFDREHYERLFGDIKDYESLLTFRIDPSTEKEILNMFRISPQGTLTLQSNIDYEQLNRKGNAEIKLSILVTLSSSAQVVANGEIIIRVLDLNDNEPEITIVPYPIDVSDEYIEESQYSSYTPYNRKTYLKLYENTIGTHYLAMIKVADKDSGPSGEVSCSIHQDMKKCESYWLQSFIIQRNEDFYHQDSSEIFQLLKDLDQKNTYNLVLKDGAKLDREEVSQISICLVCRDQDVSQPKITTEKLTISILDRNDNHPVFIKKVFKFSLPENSPIGTKIGHVTAVDADYSYNARPFYFMERDENSFLFNIESSNGSLFAQDIFDREVKLSYNLTIFVVDNRTLWSHLKSAYSKDLSEVQYSRVRDELQLEKAFVQIQIEDENDNTPFFKEPIHFEMVENTNGLIGKINAYDYDMNHNGRITFQLEHFNEKKCASYMLQYKMRVSFPDGRKDIPDYCKWKLTEDGSLFVNHGYVIDREDKEEHEIKILAIDNGIKPRTGTSMVTIKVLDVNDNDPKFILNNDQPSSYMGHLMRPVKFNISLATPDNYLLTKVEAVDPDKGKNGTLIFSLVNQIQTSKLLKMNGNLFQIWIDKNSGEMFLNRSQTQEISKVAEDYANLQPQIITSIHCNVTVKDEGEEPRSSSIQIWIDVWNNLDAIPSTSVNLYNRDPFKRVQNDAYHGKDKKSKGEPFLSRELILGLATSLVVLVILACIALMTILMVSNRNSQLKQIDLSTNGQTLNRFDMQNNGLTSYSLTKPSYSLVSSEFDKNQTIYQITPETIDHTNHDRRAISASFSNTPNGFDNGQIKPIEYNGEYLKNPRDGKYVKVIVDNDYTFLTNGQDHKYNTIKHPTNDKNYIPIQLGYVTNKQKGPSTDFYTSLSQSNDSEKIDTLFTSRTASLNSNKIV